MIHVGLPKKGVLSQSLELMGHFIDVEYIENKLTYTSKDITFHLLKHRDIPRLIAEGKLDWGVTSTDWIEECGYRLGIFNEFDWCNSRISLIGTNEREIILEDKLTCVTEFPNITRNSFLKKGFDQISIHKISGSCESMVPSVYDFCVDCVETGETLCRNSLREIEVLFNAHIAAVCTPAKLAQWKTLPL